MCSDTLADAVAFVLIIKDIRSFEVFVSGMPPHVLLVPGTRLAVTVNVVFISSVVGVTAV